jgi:hypothetical protein
VKVLITIALCLLLISQLINAVFDGVLYANKLKPIVPRKVLVNVGILNTYNFSVFTGQTLQFTADPARVCKQQRSP